MMLLFMMMSIYVLDYDDDDFVEMQLMMMRSWSVLRSVLRSRRRRSRRRSRQRRRNIWLVFALSVDKDLIKKAGKTSFI